MKLVYLAVFYPFDDQDGYTVEFPDLPGCITQGDSLEEALEMAADAAAGWILGEIEEGLDIPKPSKSINLEDFSDAEFANYICLDMEEYAKQYGQKAVKKTLTIPQWLNTLAEKNGINFSHVLQEALKSTLHLTNNAHIKTNEGELSWFANELFGRIDELQESIEFSHKTHTRSDNIIQLFDSHKYSDETEVN